MQERSLSNQREIWPGPEKRRSSRIQTDSPARLTVDNLSGAAPSIGARVLSASLQGLQLQISFILPKTPIQIQVFNRLVSGEVQYCVSAGQGFLVGVLLHEEL
jgi:hypothetical protein